MKLLLGWLMMSAVAAAAAAGAALADDKPAQQELTFDGGDNAEHKLQYLLFLPPGYEKGDAKFPLMLFLHGAGETGNDLNLVKKHGPPKNVESNRDFPFILVSPQAPTRGWKPAALLALLDHVAKSHRVDADRVYVTGLSMGGYGTWTLAAAAPERFAAILPICGFGNVDDAPKYLQLGVWVFHGDQDLAVPLDRSKEMVKAIEAAGGKPKFTVYPGVGHDSWTETYNNPAIYEWLLSHKRRGAE